MPNWCNNTVEINHKDPAKMYALVEAINKGEFCKFAIPVPESLQIVAGSLGDTEEQKKLEEATARNVEVHGYGNWYDFCVSRWGTKWDVDAYDTVEYDDQHDKNGITFGFDSAWAPPTGVYEALVEQGFSVRAYYYESGMCFAGIYDENGDDCYDIGGYNSETIKEAIPEVLDDMFAISESMADYEAENEEE
jgi:hypothetical protein